MGIVKRQSLKGSIVNYTGALIGVLSMLFIFPRLLDPNENGVIQMLLTLMQLLFVVPMLSIPSVVVVFMPYYNTDEEKAKFLSSTLLIMGCGILFFGLLFILFKPYMHQFLLMQNKNSLFKPYLRYVMPLTATFVLFCYFEAYCISKMRISVPSFIKEIGIRIVLLVAIILFYFKIISFHLLVVSVPFAYLLALLAVAIYSYRLGFRISISALKGAFQFISKEQARYILYVTLSAIGISMVSFFGPTWVGVKLGDASIAIFTLGISIATMIQIPFRSIAQITSPLFAEAWKKNDLERIKDLNTSSATNIAFIGSFMFLLLVINTTNITELIGLINAKYLGQGNEIKMVIWLVGLAKLFDMCTGLNGEIILTSPHYKFTVWSTLVLALSTFFVNDFFILRQGLLGASIAAVIIIFVFNLTKFLFLYLRFGIQPFSSKTLPLFLTLAALCLLSFFIPKIHSWYADAFLRSVLLGSVFIMLVFKFQLAPDLNGIVRKVFSLLKKNTSSE